MSGSREVQRKLILIRARSPHEPLEALLHGDFNLLRFHSYDELMQRVWDLRPQGIVIIDDHVPEGALRSLRLSEVSRELPVVLLLKDPTREMEVAALAAGADELLAGDCHPSVLRARLAAVFRRAQALERLKSSLEEMDYFVRTVTHDLKNPVASIYSCAELLGLSIENGDREEARELTGTIRQSSEHAIEFIHDLLSLLKNGTPLREVEEVPAEEVIAAALAELESKIKTSGAVITLPPDLPRLVCDKRRLTQVFTNIFSNAIKYVAPGVTPRITVNYIETPHANIFAIGDNGIGMAPEDTRRIFQTFVRLNDAAEYEGTGLGLSIVQRIVEAHEGNVFARSRKGIGSEFYVVLPTVLSFAGQLQPA